MLSSEDVDRIRDLVGAVAESDGEQPLNEEATLALAGSDPATSHFLQHEAGRVVGYAQSNARHATAQLLVHPERRRQGLGGQLLHDVAGVSVWAFGDLPPARAFAAVKGLAERRRLLVMERPLDPPSGTAYEGVRPFEPGDLDGLLAVNAAAFDWHPEQRHFSRADLDARMAEPWFDPAGLLVTADADGLTGFHWTKRHPERLGEVYVIATAPDASGYGLGGALLTAGLAHLSATGCRRVILYVESGNAAVRLYRRHGFVVARSDVMYASPERHLP